MIKRCTVLRRDERGQVIFEFIGILPLVLAGLALCFQAYVTIVAYERVHNAARTGARVASMGQDGEKAAREALPDWLIKEPSLPLCAEGEVPKADGCLETYRCVDDGKRERWETTCIDVRYADESTSDDLTDGVRATVRTEIPLLFPGAPLIIPIQASIEMPV